MPGKTAISEIAVLPRRPRGWRRVRLLFLRRAAHRPGLDAVRRSAVAHRLVPVLHGAAGVVCHPLPARRHRLRPRRLRVFPANLRDRRRITNLKDYHAQNIEGISTAIIFPIYNENVVRVCEGLRATYESLERTGQLERFDFFILSDSTDPDHWVEEERRWYDLIRELDALGRIYYRRRLVNEARKSGNVRDFLNTWGRRYRYFICCDADSVIRGETLVDLVQADGGASPGGPDPDRARAGQCGIPVRPHPAICQPPLRPRVHRRAELLGARGRQLLGPQRHHPHRALHAVLRPAATARAANPSAARFSATILSRPR